MSISSDQSRLKAEPIEGKALALGDVGKVIALLWFMCTLGLASLVFPAYGSSNPWRVLAVGFFLAGGSTLVGSAVGFLFGVPRHTTRMTRSSSYVPNTNLERISDWLTKILIGAGLSQASDLVRSLTSLAHFAGPVFGEAPAGPTIAGALIVHYLLVGFFQGFLLAYLWLPNAFARIFPGQSSDPSLGDASEPAQPKSSLHQTEPPLRSGSAGER